MNKNVGTIIAALVLGIFVGYFLNSGSGVTLQKDEVLKTINEDLVASPVEVKLKSSQKVGELTELTLDFNGQEDKLYVTNDGKQFFQKIYDKEEAEKAKQAAKEAMQVKNKSEKPEVELFVMSYCPFGTQMEKGYLPAIRALGDTVDAKVKFVNYIMHGEKEARENVLQYCIQEEMPEKYNDYLACFLDKGEGSSDACLAEVGIQKEALDSCIANTTKNFEVQKDLDDKDSYLSGRFPHFKVHEGLNEKYGVQGSPTLVVNGQKIDGAGRDAQSILDIICSAFEEKPEVCNTKLSSNTPNPGFGYDANADASAAGGCGA